MGKKKGRNQSDPNKSWGNNTSQQGILRNQQRSQPHGGQGQDSHGEPSSRQHGQSLGGPAGSQDSQSGYTRHQGELSKGSGQSLEGQVSQSGQSNSQREQSRQQGQSPGCQAGLQAGQPSSIQSHGDQTGSLATPSEHTRPQGEPLKQGGQSRVVQDGSQVIQSGQCTYQAEPLREQGQFYRGEGIQCRQSQIQRSSVHQGQSYGQAGPQGIYMQQNRPQGQSVLRPQVQSHRGQTRSHVSVTRQLMFQGDRSTRQQGHSHSSQGTHYSVATSSSQLSGRIQGFQGQTFSGQQRLPYRSQGSQGCQSSQASSQGEHSSKHLGLPHGSQGSWQSRQQGVPHGSQGSQGNQTWQSLSQGEQSSRHQALPYGSQGSQGSQSLQSSRQRSLPHKSRGSQGNKLWQPRSQGVPSSRQQGLDGSQVSQGSQSQQGLSWQSQAELTSNSQGTDQASGGPPVSFGTVPQAGAYGTQFDPNASTGAGTSQLGTFDKYGVWKPLRPSLTRPPQDRSNIRTGGNYQRYPSYDGNRVPIRPNMFGGAGAFEQPFYQFHQQFGQQPPVPEQAHSSMSIPGPSQSHQNLTDYQLDWGYPTSLVGNQGYPQDPTSIIVYDPVQGMYALVTQAAPPNLYSQSMPEPSHLHPVNLQPHQYRRSYSEPNEQQYRMQDQSSLDQSRRIQAYNDSWNISDQQLSSCQEVMNQPGQEAQPQDTPDPDAYLEQPTDCLLPLVEVQQPAIPGFIFPEMYCLQDASLHIMPHHQVFPYPPFQPSGLLIHAVPQQSTTPSIQQEQNIQLQLLNEQQLTRHGERTDLPGQAMQQRDFRQQLTHDTHATGQVKTETKKVETDEICKLASTLRVTEVPKPPPPPGRNGRPILIETNHFDLTLNLKSEKSSDGTYISGDRRGAYHYTVTVEPNAPKRYIRQLIDLVRQRHFNEIYPAFDGTKNMYTILPIKDNLTMKIKDEIDFLNDNNRERRYKVEIKWVKTINLAALGQLSQRAETPREALECLDVVLRSASVSSCISVGRSFFMTPSELFNLGQGMQMYNGFYQSAIRGSKPFLNVDVTNKAFPKNISCINALIEVLNIENCPPQLTDDQEETFRKFITTLRVSYELPDNPASNRVYRVNGLGKSAQQENFLHEGEEISVENYFKEIKNYEIRYPALPTLWAGSMDREPRILLPMELCKLIEGQPVNRKMTEEQTRRMIRLSVTSATQRKEKIQEAITKANYNEDLCIRQFGFTVGREFQTLEARVLVPPALKYGQNHIQNPRKGMWANGVFIKGTTIDRWTIATTVDCSMEKLYNLATEIRTFADGCGMTFTTLPEIPATPIADKDVVTIENLKTFFENLEKNEKTSNEKQESKKYDIVFIVIPDTGPVYSYVKTLAEIEYGFMTQCIKLKTVNNLTQPMVKNLLLKVNSKLNGKNHCVSTETAGILKDKTVMVMGADVSHPGPEITNMPSVAAVAASHDLEAFQYNICWRLQPPKETIIQDLENITKEQLSLFRKKTNQLPELIIFFRVGVSEAKYEAVKEKEIKAIRSACERLKEEDGIDYEPKISFLAVQKRHHTRLFPKVMTDSEDSNGNVPAGTCVDTVITNSFIQEFYLVSHGSLHGVSIPTKYYTMKDDNNLTNDQIQQLTYYLCHMFARCNRAVSYPAPAYYAQLAAARVKVYIEKENIDLDSLAFESDRFKLKERIRENYPMFFV